MKALQKNQGRTDQMLGSMAEVSSIAMPNQQWVSCDSVFVYALTVSMKAQCHQFKRHRHYGGTIQSLWSMIHMSQLISGLHIPY